MQEWLTAQMAQGFPAFQGAAVTGSIPVQETLINDLIARFLAEAHRPPGAAPAFDPRALLPLVRHATIHADAGVVTLNFELGI